MRTADKYGAYAEYSVRILSQRNLLFPHPFRRSPPPTPSSTSAPRPPSKVRLPPLPRTVLTLKAEATTLPLAYMTAAIGLFLRLGLPTPLAPSTASPKLPILVWGASTTVGIYAIQLAKVRSLFMPLTNVHSPKAATARQPPRCRHRRRRLRARPLLRRRRDNRLPLSLSRLPRRRHHALRSRSNPSRL